MAAYIARETLGAAESAAPGSDTIQVLIPNEKGGNAVLLEISGTYVGQIAVESRADESAAFAAVSLFDAGDGTAGIAANEEGFFVGEIAAGQGELRISFSSYTSGEAEVQLAILPAL